MKAKIYNEEGRPPGLPEEPQAPSGKPQASSFGHN